MKRIVFVLAILAMVLAACGGGGDDDSSTDGGNAGSDLSEVIQWDRSPTNVVFRSDVVAPGSEDDLFARAEIPPCSIYGDNRVVWTVESEDPLDSVLFGPIDDPRMRAFIDTQTVFREIYTYTEEAALQLDPELPAYEQLFINVNDLEHRTDIYSNWPPDYYEEITEECRTLSPRPQIYRPSGAWLRVEERPYNTNAPSIIWDPEVTGVNLAEIATSGEPIWIEGDQLNLLWTYRLRGSFDLQYGQQEGNYVVGLEIPGVTRHSPPAP